MNLHVGTSGYSYKEWKGKFYPEKFAAKDMLRFYGEHFGTVEVNYTFRTLPTEAMLETWMSAVPMEFKFALKAPQRITHMKRLNDCGEALKEFLEVAAKLKKRLGPVLFQLPPNFKCDVPRLSVFLKLLPRRCRAAFEFRHESWFNDEVFALLRKHHVALCVAEADDDLKVPFEVTADWIYLRLRAVEYSDAELKAWIKRLRKHDLGDVFLFFKHEDQATGPTLAKRFLELATPKR